MERHDYILMEIEKISVMLTGIFGRLTRMREDMAIHARDAYTTAREMILDGCDLDLDVLLNTPAGDLEKMLTLERGFNAATMEKLAGLLPELDNSTNTERGILLRRKAIDLLELINRQEKTYSMVREDMIRQIREQLIQAGEKEL